MRALPELRKRWLGARIIHELPLRYSERRIDLAAVTEDKIILVEIKSSKDVADRLESQLRGFLPISYLVCVALAPKWNEKRSLVPRKVRGGTHYDEDLTECQAVIKRIGYRIETWTVDAVGKTVEKTDGGYAYNPWPWPYKMLEVLHVAELAEIAFRHRIYTGKRPCHTKILEACCEHMNGREVRAAVCRALRARNAFAKESDPPILVEKHQPAEALL